MDKKQKVLDIARLRSYNWERLTGSNKVSLSPCFLGCVLVTGDAQGVTDITLYDGESANDPVLLTVRGNQNATKMLHFEPPIKTERGLYIVFGSNVQEVLVKYERLQE